MMKYKKLTTPKYLYTNCGSDNWHILEDSRHAYGFHDRFEVGSIVVKQAREAETVFFKYGHLSSCGYCVADSSDRTLCYLMWDYK